MDFYLARRVRGLTLLGIMGEAPKLTPAESRAVVRRALARVAGRVPVVVGVSNAELGALAALANDAMAAGAAGVMVAPAPGLAGDAALVDYMASVFAAVVPAPPVVYQDYPQAAGVPLTVEVFHRMVEAFPRLVMLKHEDCPGLTKLRRIRAETARAGRRRVSVLVGNNAIYYPQELARGADGAMTGFWWRSTSGSSPATPRARRTSSTSTCRCCVMRRSRGSGSPFARSCSSAAARWPRPPCARPVSRWRQRTTGSSTASSRDSSAGSRPERAIVRSARRHHLDHRAAQHLGIDRLREVRPEAGGERHVAWVLAGERRHRHRRHVARVPVPRDLTHQPVAVLARHRNVADDRVGTVLQVRVEARFRRLGDEHLGAAQLEHRAYDLAGVVVVLDDEHRGAVELHGRRLYPP